MTASSRVATSGRSTRSEGRPRAGIREVDAGRRGQDPDVVVRAGRDAVEAERAARCPLAGTSSSSPHPGPRGPPWRQSRVVHSLHVRGSRAAIVRVDMVLHAIWNWPSGQTWRQNERPRRRGRPPSRRGRARPAPRRSAGPSQGSKASYATSQPTTRRPRATRPKGGGPPSRRPDPATEQGSRSDERVSEARDVADDDGPDDDHAAPVGPGSVPARFTGRIRGAEEAVEHDHDQTSRTNRRTPAGSRSAFSNRPITGARRRSPPRDPARSGRGPKGRLGKDSHRGGDPEVTGRDDHRRDEVDDAPRDPHDPGGQLLVEPGTIPSAPESSPYQR